MSHTSRTDQRDRQARTGWVMPGRGALLIAGLGTAGAVLVSSTPASAQPVEKGHFHDVFTSDVYDCNGTPAQDAVDVSGNFLVNQRGDLSYARESVHGSVVTTNLNTGGTLTQKFATTTRAHAIVDNGNDTITITVFAQGGLRYYDADGGFVLKDPGHVRFAFDVDLNGTPDDPSDDEFVPDSFRIVRSSTGNSDTSHLDDCDLLLQYTS